MAHIATVCRFWTTHRNVPLRRPARTALTTAACRIPVGPERAHGQRNRRSAARVRSMTISSYSPGDISLIALPAELPVVSP